jgi:hypothetical protein
MHEADKIYLSKFLIDSDIDSLGPAGQNGILNQEDMFLDTDNLSELDLDGWFDPE